MARIEKYEPIVRDILERNPKARGNDKILYYWVLRDMGFETNMSISYFLLSDIYPNWESVTRVRRRLQEQNPELRPDENILKSREEAEEEFVEYARG